MCCGYAHSALSFKGETARELHRSCTVCRIQPPSQLLHSVIYCHPVPGSELGVTGCSRQKRGTCWAWVPPLAMEHGEMRLGPAVPHSCSRPPPAQRPFPLAELNRVDPLCGHSARGELSMPSQSPDGGRVWGAGEWLGVSPMGRFPHQGKHQARE